jgi:hypothetical protein
VTSKQDLDVNRSFHWRIFWVSLIPLSVIFIGEIFKILFFLEMPLMVPQEEVKVYVDRVNLLELFLSPIIGFLSDKFGRKLILVITLFFLTLSTIFLTILPSINAAVWFYALGAITPVARAAYCDVHITNQRTPNIINTFIIQPIPWMIFSNPWFINPISFFPNHYTLTFLFFASFIMSIFICYYFDSKESRVRSNKSFEFEKIKKEYGLWLCMRIIIAFFISNSLWNMLLFFFEENEAVETIGLYFFLSQGCAFFLGAVIARLADIDIKKMLGLLFVLIAISLSIQVIAWSIQKYEGNIIPSVFASFTFFGGITLPLIYAFFGRKADLHEQGVLYGLLESLQSFTDWTGAYSLNHNTDLNSYSTLLIVVLIGSGISLMLTVSLIRTRWRFE